jgi:hypothetical protein
VKIAFLLPTLQFGRDGIADYTQKIASWSVGQGHETRIIPLGRNDWLRDRNGLTQRMADAQSQIVAFAPDVVSWQFDSQIFHPQAIFPSWVVPRFHTGQAIIHLMAHETWSSGEKNPRLRRRLKGIMQRRSVLKGLKIIKPDLCHTSNELYAHHLRSCNLKSTILPLPSAISALEPIRLETNYLAPVLKLVFFGGFHDNWDPRPFLMSLRKTSGKFEIHHVGMIKSGLEFLQEGCRDWADLIQHGEASEYNVSKILMNAHFGVSSYNLSHLRKSSIYAAFIEHGLPVLSPRQDFHQTVNYGPLAPNLILWSPPFPSLREFHRFPLVDTLRQTGNQFLNDINNFMSGVKSEHELAS